jgi:hypothetical protein
MVAFALLGACGGARDEGGDVAGIAEVYPTKDVFSRLALEASWSPETSRNITRAWTRIRTGK